MQLGAAQADRGDPSILEAARAELPYGRARNDGCGEARLDRATEPLQIVTRPAEEQIDAGMPGIDLLADRSNRPIRMEVEGMRLAHS